MNERWLGGWPVYSPRNHVELAMIESILAGDGVTYFVHNHHFGALEVGPSIALYNRRTILVPDADVDRAQELLDEYLESTETRWGDLGGCGLWDRIRVTLEALAFGWFIPGRRWQRARRNRGE